jgi:hypothetical protein
VATNWPLVFDALADQGMADRPVLIAALSTIAVETGSFAPIPEYASVGSTRAGPIWATSCRATARAIAAGADPVDGPK